VEADPLSEGVGLAIMGQVGGASMVSFIAAGALPCIASAQTCTSGAPIARHPDGLSTRRRHLAL